MIFLNNAIHIRELIQGKDEKLLQKWLSDSLVLQFYEGRDLSFTLEDVKRKFFNRNDVITRCLVVYQGDEIGYIQYYPINPDTSNISDYQGMEGIYGLDQFIGESEFWNKGIGTMIITSTVAFLFNEKKVSTIIMDPMTSNKRAIKCYEKCGFRKVKVLPKHLLHEGVYRDCLLMEYTNDPSDDIE